MKQVGIIGGGAMGSGIAQIAATAGCKVILYDTKPEALELSKEKLTKIMVRLVEKEKLNLTEANAIKSNITYTDNLEAIAKSDLIIEAIVENLDIKKSVFSAVEKIVSRECIIASNTSSLSITSIAAACKNPERVIGIHFFNPAPLMPLVEIIPALQTTEQVAKDARLLIDSWGKVTVMAKDTPGFIVNRVARPFYGEAIRIFEEGIADVATIDWAMKELGEFRMGPFELTDYIGHDVNFVVTETVFKAFYYDPRFKPSFSQKRLVEAGRLGRKSGHGFYDYSENAPKPKPSKDLVLGKRIVNRILAMLINEAADALFLNIASAKDLDLAMTKGVNYPKGLLVWADEIGLDVVLKQMEELYKNYCEDRYRPSPLLRKMVREQKTFF
ncbi:MAG: 3-hydroxyacyl-CoA dehydrogenase NAD-binding domain-containing protein [Flavobacteriales bacterium]|nr:3-hydroxyacyl-CoA dehydrogenase NAD-binding domain-containing protein [Flavobacteriales bacterium]